MTRLEALGLCLRRLDPSQSIFRSRIQPLKLLLGCRAVSTQSSLVPRIGQSSFWRSIVPRSIRNRLQKTETAVAEFKQRSNRPANPASYFIWIWILIGSQAIRTLQIQHEFGAFMRRADVKIGKLREVVEALQRGEEIDVERALGTGDQVQELEWEEALREIEDEDRLWQKNKQEKVEARQRAKEEALKEANDANNASPVNDASEHQEPEDEQLKVSQQGTPVTPGFY